jgi:hypothetical protein
MTEANIYRDGRIHVRGEKCHNCLYSPDRLVSGARARELTTETRAEVGSTFICHKSQVTDEPEAICSEWFRNFGKEDPLLRLAMAWGVIQYVDVQGESNGDS